MTSVFAFFCFAFERRFLVLLFYCLFCYLFLLFIHRISDFYYLSTHGHSRLSHKTKLPDGFFILMSLAGGKQFLSLLSITSYSSFAFHKFSVAVYNSKCCPALLCARWWERWAGRAWPSRQGCCVDHFSSQFPTWRPWTQPNSPRGTATVWTTGPMAYQVGGTSHDLDTLPISLVPFQIRSN